MLKKAFNTRALLTNSYFAPDRNFIDLLYRAQTLWRRCPSVCHTPSRVRTIRRCSAAGYMSFPTASCLRSALVPYEPLPA